MRADLGVPQVASHSFRKTVATLIDDGGLSARIGADQLGHSKVSMTQDRYTARGRVHTEVADLLDAAINAGSVALIVKKQPLKWGGRGSIPRPRDYEAA